MRQELSEYQFFQSLYGDTILDKGEDDEDSARIKRLMKDIQREKHLERSREAQKKIDRELRTSPVRKGYYVFLIATLVSVCGYEIFFTEHPSGFHVGLYGMIAFFMSLQLYKESMHLKREES